MLPIAADSGRQRGCIIRQNLVASLAIVSLLIPMALFGLVGVGVAVALHEGSTLVVTGVASRLIRFPELAEDATAER